MSNCNNHVGKITKCLLPRTKLKLPLTSAAGGTCALVHSQFESDGYTVSCFIWFIFIYYNAIKDVRVISSCRSEFLSGLASATVYCTVLDLLMSLFPLS